MPSQPAIEERSESKEIFTEWNSDIKVLREYIKQNLSQAPSSIQTFMRSQRQEFSLSTIKENKRLILDEIFPREPRVAFHPTNCRVTENGVAIDENLFRHYAQIPIQRKKGNGWDLQEYYIFTTRLMLYQLSRAEQWFVDGTFSAAPSGFQQVFVFIVYIPHFRIFYPSCYILMTGKSEKIYYHAFSIFLLLPNKSNFL